MDFKKITLCSLEDEHIEKIVGTNCTCSIKLTRFCVMLSLFAPDEFCLWSSRNTYYNIINIETHLFHFLVVFTLAVVCLSRSPDVLHSLCISKGVFMFNFFKVSSEMGQEPFSPVVFDTEYSSVRGVVLSMCLLLQPFSSACFPWFCVCLEVLLLGGRA